MYVEKVFRPPDTWVCDIRSVWWTFQSTFFSLYRDIENIFHYVQENVKISKKQGIDDTRIVSGSVQGNTVIKFLKYIS